MTETVKLKLKKPAQDDFYNIEDHNGNADIIDQYAISQEAELNKLRTKDQNLDVEIANLKKKDTAQDTEIQAVKTKDVSQDTEISKLKTADIDLGKRIDGVISKNTLQDGEITALKSKDGTFATDIVGLRAKDTSQDTEIGKLKTADTDLGKRIDGVVSKNSAQDSEIAALKTKDIVVNTDITALRAKDSSQDTEINKLKAADITYSDAIKAEAQMKKITRDHGAPILTVQVGEDVFEKFDELETGFYFVNIVAGAKNSPVTTSAFFGTVKKSFSSKLYWTADFVNYTTGRIHSAANQNGVRRGWYEAATLEHVEMQKKSVVAEAQMSKLTYDNGSTYTVSGGFANFVKTMGRGVKFVYMNKDGAPDGPGTIRGIISQTGDPNETYPLGYYWAMGIDYSGNIWTSHTNPQGTDVVKWNKFSPTSTLSGTATPSNALGSDGDIYVQYI